MSQTWTANVYDIDHIVNTDMTNVEVNFTTLKNSFAGTTSPAATVAGQIYFNTSKKIHHFLNATESAFLGLLPGDLNTKIWQYRNDATPGWVIDNSVTDKVIALKGGSDGYNVSGGTIGGSYSHTHTGPSHTHTGPSHSHTGASHKHLTTIGLDGSGTALKQTAPGGTSQQAVNHFYGGSGDLYSSGIFYHYTNNTTPGTGGASGTGATGAAGTGATGGSTTFRPQAAVGTLQYPDVTQA